MGRQNCPRVKRIAYQTDRYKDKEQMEE